MTIRELTEKRKYLWEKYHDSHKDRQFVELVAKEIIKNPNLLKELREDPTLLIECTFTIIDKDKKAVPFFLNDVQEEFLTTFRMVEKDKKEMRERGLESKYLTKPFAILKGRQQGFTSLITAIQLCYALLQENFSGMTIADTDDNTAAIFSDKAKYYYEMLPECLHPEEKASNKKELVFSKLHSAWRIQVASDDAGRSRSLSCIHFSESAFFKCDMDLLTAAVGQAMTKYSIQFYESTANGYNDYKELWDSGRCINMFFEWWKTKEYQLKNTYIIDDILEKEKDEWLTSRVEWLRKKGLNENQIAWYCNKYTQYNNKMLLRQEYPCTPEEAFISTGECAFNTQDLLDRLEEIKTRPPVRLGKFTYVKEYLKGGRQKLNDIKWVDCKDGFISIVEEPKADIEYDYLDRPTGIKFLHPYTIGGDTAGEGSDYYTAKVINNETRQTAATLRCLRMEDDIYADQLACLGYYYNNALIGVEANFSYQPNRVLEQLEYPFIYRRTREDSITHIVEQKIGFMTTKKTRPLIVNELQTILRECGAWIETDVETLKEMLTFCRRTGGKYEAQPGCHDDLVMALCIAHYVFEDQGTLEKIQVGEYDKSLDNEFFARNEPEEQGVLGEWFLPS